jgi:hypothetical protein
VSNEGEQERKEERGGVSCQAGERQLPNEEAVDAPNARQPTLAATKAWTAVASRMMMMLVPSTFAFNIGGRAMRWGRWRDKGSQNGTIPKVCDNCFGTDRFALARTTALSVVNTIFTSGTRSSEFFHCEQLGSLFALASLKIHVDHIKRSEHVKLLHVIG